MIFIKFLNFLAEFKQNKSYKLPKIFIYYNSNSFLFAKLANFKASASANTFITEAFFDKI